MICGGIHMSDIPSFPYALLWGERAIRSVANLTRRDGEELLALAPGAHIRTDIDVPVLDLQTEGDMVALRAHLTHQPAPAAVATTGWHCVISEPSQAST